MSNITFGPRLIEQQLAASNRLFQKGYEVGYEAGLKYAVEQILVLREKLEGPILFVRDPLPDPLDPCDVGSPVDRA